MIDLFKDLKAKHEDQEEFIQKFVLENPLLVETDGSGFWSDKVKTVKVIGLIIESIKDEDEDEDIYGQIQFIFDTETWDINEDGLIYTDNAFEKAVKEFLYSRFVSNFSIGYSEQGMQGKDYVDFDFYFRNVS